VRSPHENAPQRTLRVFAGTPNALNTHRGIVAALTCVVLSLVLASCHGKPASQPPSAVRASTHSASSATSKASDRCGSGATAGTVITFRAADGTTLDGALVGHARTCVVLVHEYPADLCGFLPYAEYLAAHGIEALALDLRCFGNASCPASAAARAQIPQDVAAGAAELRRRGVSDVALLGASLGCTIALIAAPTVHPAPTSVVCLSGHARYTATVGTTAVPLDAAAAVRHTTSPALFVVAAGDPLAGVAEVRALYADYAGRTKRLDVLSGAYTGSHGWDLLSRSSTWTPLAAQLAAYLGRL
jgi:pimeloyl-ACP methyl ester carboxylesterase